MHWQRSLSLFGWLAVAATAQAPAPVAAVPAKQELAVLYVGSAEGPRTSDFVQFLQQHFTTVGTAVYANFDARQADPYDVVVLDVEMKPKENSIGIGPQPTLPADYARATVLISGPGVIVSQKFGSKLDWY
jgi:hypothetical protein